jgi:enoyl-CoA hydratase/carnithine racemase
MLKVSRDGPVAILTIDRAGRRNAIGAELVERLLVEFRVCDSDTAVRAIVLDGVPPGFCAGSDLKELATMDVAGMCRHEADTAAMARSINLMNKPVVAAVEGFALGGGFTLAVSCDLVVTTPSCRWHLPEVTIGWIPPWGLGALTARAGPVTARRLVWGSEAINGEEAHRLRVADYLAADGAASTEAIRLAQRLAALPPPAVTSTKRFFAPLASQNGEPADAMANWMFADNGRHEAALATLRKFDVKVG